MLDEGNQQIFNKKGELRVKKLLVMLVFLLIFISCSACSFKRSEASIEIPEHSVHSENVQIQSFTISDFKEQVDYLNTELFESLISISNADIPYIELGEIIVIKLQDNLSSPLELIDFILNEDGTLKYTYHDDNIDVSKLYIRDGEVSFVLSENQWAYFSSQSSSYEKGATLRGFKLIGSNAEGKREYVFIIRTDAM